MSTLAGGLRISAVFAGIVLSLAGHASDVGTRLVGEIEARRQRVPEFVFIAEQAQKLGVRAWLFGGTAAGYAHYVKWDLQRELGDPRFQAERFDYDYTNIFRSTQDLDIVIDGDAKQADTLRRALVERYPSFQGGKDANWEVRLLTQDMADKQALLRNPDFINQHTDSNSTGMIEVTKPALNESVVRDLRDWDSKDPQFLRDVREGRLHYYFSPTHGETSRAIAGENPPILSAIRYLTKAFQYELEMRPEDLEKIRKVIDDFNPKGSEAGNSYVAKWIEKNGKKLIQNAVNIEYAFETLERLSLRKKLISLKDEASRIDSLAWWMSREPLRTKPVGQGTGRTAAEVFAEQQWANPGQPLIVAHETNSFLAYESISRAHTGDPNVLISRNGFVGEVAAAGDGFYAKVGREGARGTGLTLRFTLDPKAREGTDFTFNPSTQFFVIKNKAAMKVIPESLNLSAPEFFRILAQGQSFEHADRGIMEKFKRRIGGGRVSTEDQEKVARIVRDAADGKFGKYAADAVIREWLLLPYATEDLKLAEYLIEKRRGALFTLSGLFENPKWLHHPHLLNRLIDSGELDDELANEILTRPKWRKTPAFVERLIDRNLVGGTILRKVLSQPEWKDRGDLVERILRAGKSDREVVQMMVAESGWSQDPRRLGLLKSMRGRKEVDVQIALRGLIQPESATDPELLKSVVQGGNADWYLARYVLTKPHWSNAGIGAGSDAAVPDPAEDALRELIRRGQVDEQIGRFTLNSETWKNHPKREEFERLLVSNGRVTQAKLDSWLRPDPSSSASKKIDDILTKLNSTKQNGTLVISRILEDYFHDSEVTEHPRAGEVIRAFIAAQKQRGFNATEFGMYEKWAIHPEWREAFRAGEMSVTWFTVQLLKEPFWPKDPEAVEIFRSIYESSKSDVVRSLILTLSHTRQVSNNPKGLPPFTTVDVAADWHRHPEITAIVDELLRTPSLRLDDLNRLLLRPEVQGKVDPIAYLTTLYRKGYEPRAFSHKIKDQSFPWPERHEGHEIMLELIRSKKLYEHELKDALARPGWAESPAGYSLVLEQVKILLEHSGGGIPGPVTSWEKTIDALMWQPHWRRHPELRKICGETDPAYYCLREAVVKRGRFWPDPASGFSCVRVQLEKRLEAIE